MAATEFRDYYEILGISKTATPEAIKRAYRKLARKYHPDRNPNDADAEQRFKEINEAQEILSDPEKRQKYDQFGQYWKQAAAGAAPGSGGGFDGADFSQYGSFDDFVNELLGRFARGSSAARDADSGRRVYTYRTTSGPAGFREYRDFGGGDPFRGFGGSFSQRPTQDAEATIGLTLAEAFHGTQKRLQIGDETVTVRIPAGAKAGSRLRLKGKGLVSPMQRQRGDLYLTIDLQPHSFFKFDGDNLTCEVPIRPDEAVLGATIAVPTPDGIVQMQVPQGTNSGQALRVRGKGWRNPKGKRSDLIVRVKIVTPSQPSPREQELYAQIRANSQFQPRQTIAKVSL